jgi:hypothetical protein
MRNLVLAATLWVAALAATSHARIWNVTADGLGDAPTIQAAVDSASSGDRIHIGPGTYHEMVALKSGLTLSGVAGPEMTTLHATDFDPYCVTSDGTISDVVIEGLTLTGIRQEGPGPCPNEAALYILGSFVLQDCIVADNDCPSDRAPLMAGGDDVSVLGCVFRDNFTGHSCGGIDPGGGVGAIWAWGGTLHVSGCRFDHNVGGSVGLVSSLSDVVFENSVVHDSQVLYSGPLFMKSGTRNLTVRNSLFVGSLCAVFALRFTNPPTLHLEGNTFADNVFYDYDDPDWVGAGSVIRANVFAGGNVGLWLPDGGAGIAVECNDAWDNEQNWAGFDPAPGGNFSLDPLFCDAAAGNYEVAGNSPLLAANNPCGVQIGAFGQGCGPISIGSRTWGRIKAAYRSGP